MLRKYSKLYTDNHLQHPIYDLDLSFSDYITQTKKIIADTRADLKENNAEKIIEANAPFEFLPVEKKPTVGALLIHGLLDSPFDMRDIGKGLQEHGLLVRSILLPGHGTVPGDLLNVKAEEWLQAMRYGFTSLTKEVEKIYLVGFSTGAALIIYAMLSAMIDTSKVAGIILMSPAIKIRSRLDFTTNWYPFLLGRFWERAKWLHVEKEEDYVRYQSITFNAGYQVFRLTRMIKNINHGKTIQHPMQFILSAGDTTISAKAYLEFFKKNLNANSQMILYSDDPTKNLGKNITVRTAIYPDLRIRNFSHISIPISPTNPHYGRNGDYAYASRIDEHEDNIIYGALNKFHLLLLKLLLKAEIMVEQHQRLTFNPDFEFMLGEIKKFTAV